MEDNEKMILISKKEYEDMKEQITLLENDKDMLASTIKIMEGKIDDLNNNPQIEKVIEVRFEGFLKRKKERDDTSYYSWKDVCKKEIDSIQFAVTPDLVGYERDKVFDKLKELTDTMKEELNKEFEKRYEEDLEKAKEFGEKYCNLVYKIEDWNKKHLFKIKIDENK